MVSQQSNETVDAGPGAAKPLHERFDRERCAAPGQDLVKIVDAVELVHRDSFLRC